jgi:hypothetical protein
VQIYKLILFKTSFFKKNLIRKIRCD